MSIKRIHRLVTAALTVTLMLPLCVIFHSFQGAVGGFRDWKFGVRVFWDEFAVADAVEKEGKE